MSEQLSSHDNNALATWNQYMKENVDVSFNVAQNSKFHKTQENEKVLNINKHVDQSSSLPQESGSMIQDNSADITMDTKSTYKPPQTGYRCT